MGQSIQDILSSNITYGIVLGIFALQLLWLAFVMNYPALFDEEFHLGIIDIYSRQFSPFITMQPPEAAFHGDITRYGSYLFHYLMSYPYWLISQYTGDIKTQVIFLRIICIVFVLLGVFMWRKFLLRARVGKSTITAVTLFFTLIPLVSLALSQLNYDSLAFLVVPSLFYITLRVTEKNKRQIVWLIGLISLSFVGVLVKFTLLPIAFVCVLVAIGWIGYQYKKDGVKILVKQYKQLKTGAKIGLVCLCIVSAGLFIERYATNIVQYRAIEPKCDQVHSRESCMQYTVYKRDTTWRENNDKINKQRDSAYTYTTTYWAPHIFNDFFVVGALVYDHQQPLEIRYLPKNIEASGGIPFLRSAGWIIMYIALLLILVRLPYLWKHYRVLVVLVLGTLVVYGVALWLRNYTDYLKIGTGTAAQGRYFIPLLIGIFTLGVLSISSLLKRIRYKAALLGVGLLIISQGGGISTYILKSHDSWYWADQRAAISQIHQNIRKVLDIFIRS